MINWGWYGRTIEDDYEPDDGVAIARYYSEGILDFACSYTNAYYAFSLFLYGMDEADFEVTSTAVSYIQFEVSSDSSVSIIISFITIGY